MGRDAMVTFEQVAATADAIKTEGGKPTSRLVRARLGDVGSMGTINKFLSSWKASQQREIASALVLPAQLQRILLEHIDSEITSARSALEAEVAAQQQEAGDLATENERQGVEIEKLVEDLESVRAEAAGAAGRAEQLEADLHLVRDDVGRERMAAEQARTELAKAQLRLEAMPRLESDLDAAREALDTERTARRAAEQAAAVLTAQLSAESKTAAAATEKVGQLDATVKQLQDQITALQAQKSAAEQSAAVSEAQRAAAAARADETAAEAAAKVEQLDAMIKQMQDQITALQTQKSAAEQSAAVSDAQRAATAAREDDTAQRLAVAEAGAKADKNEFAQQLKTLNTRLDAADAAAADYKKEVIELKKQVVEASKPATGSKSVALVVAKKSIKKGE